MNIGQRLGSLAVKLAEEPLRQPVPELQNPLGPQEPAPNAPHVFPRPPGNLDDHNPPPLRDPAALPNAEHLFQPAPQQQGHAPGVRVPSSLSHVPRLVSNLIWPNQPGAVPDAPFFVNNMADLGMPNHGFPLNRLALQSHGRSLMHNINHIVGQMPPPPNNPPAPPPAPHVPGNIGNLAGRLGRGAASLFR